MGAPEPSEGLENGCTALLRDEYPGPWVSGSNFCVWRSLTGRCRNFPFQRPADAEGSADSIRPKGSGKSKLDPFRPEIEALLANGSTQKFIVKRYNTTAAAFQTGSERTESRNSEYEILWRNRVPMLG